MTKKEAIAKLYNLKSAVDGMIPLVDSGIIAPNVIGDAVAGLAAKLCDEVTKRNSETDYSS